MNLVDSSGWIEFVTDGSGAEFFAASIETQDSDFEGLEGVRFQPKD